VFACGTLRKLEVGRISGLGGNMPAQGAPRLGSEPTDGKHKSPPRIGAERLVALIERSGYRRFTAACSAVTDYTSG
jgi:hypothetical protein